jgi:hypothetical protein
MPTATWGDADEAKEPPEAAALPPPEVVGAVTGGDPHAQSEVSGQCRGCRAGCGCRSPPPTVRGDRPSVNRYGRTMTSQFDIYSR